MGLGEVHKGKRPSCLRDLGEDFTIYLRLRGGTYRSLSQSLPLKKCWSTTGARVGETSEQAKHTSRQKEHPS